MSYKVEFVLDLDDSYSSVLFDRKNWKDYTFRFKEVFGGKLTNISGHIPVGEYGHIKWVWNFKDESEAKWWMTYGDYYVDVYWKKKRIATEIRLREPQMGHWYSDAPNYDLRDGYQDANFKADKAKFDKLTSIKVALKLATTPATSAKQGNKAANSGKQQTASDATKTQAISSIGCPKGILAKVAIPNNVNSGLTAVSSSYMIELLGKPRANMTQDCAPITNKALLGKMSVDNVGPFKVSGLKLAIESLKMIMLEIKTKYPDLYKEIGTAGMLCCRLQRGSKSAISNHSWGSAIDLTLSKQLDTYGDGVVQCGLTQIAEIFNRHGWYWGAKFRKEDGMHFEISKNKFEEWKSEGKL